MEQAAHVLEGKELGIVLTTGVAEKEYQAGGKEEYTISEFLRPYQRIANKFHMTYLPPFVLAQFMYLSQEKRWEKLIAYQQYLSLEGSHRLLNGLTGLFKEYRKIRKCRKKIRKNKHIS